MIEDELIQSIQAASVALLTAYKAYLLVDKHMPKAIALREEINLHAGAIQAFSVALKAVRVGG
jgi:hypothetical protein